MIDPEKAVRVIGVPLDLGVSRLGVDMGPAALRYAGILNGLRYGQIAYVDAGDIPVVTSFSLDSLDIESRREAELDEVIRVSGILGEMVYEAHSKGEIPLVLGGDHSSSIGAIAGIAKAASRMGLIWIDAHPDANTPSTSPSGNIHGMPLAISLGYGPEKLVQCMGFSPKVHPENVCIIGAKDIDPGEQDFLKERGVICYTTFDIFNNGIAAVMKEATDIVTNETDYVYVSFDADVMDHKLAPGTGITTKGGLSYREIAYIMQYLGKNIEIGGLDIIEVNPLLDKMNITAELCVELAMSLLGIKYTDYEKGYLRDNIQEEGLNDD